MSFKQLKKKVIKKFSKHPQNKLGKEELAEKVDEHVSTQSVYLCHLWGSHCLTVPFSAVHLGGDRCRRQSETVKLSGMYLVLTEFCICNLIMLH